MNHEDIDYTKASDIDLIRLFCSGPPDREAFDALWKRYEPKIKGFSRVLTSMCPSSCSREIFHDEIFSEMQERVLKQVCGYERRIPFSAWLWMLGQGTAIDKRRKIIGRPPGTPREFVPLTEAELAGSGAVFRDKLKQDVVRDTLEGERAVIVDRVFYRYSKTEGGFDSLSALYRHFHAECTVKEVARRLCTYERKIFRMFDHDCEALQSLFAEAGINNVGDLFTD